MAILCRYRYDALDRLASCEPAAQPGALQFYLKNRLTVEIQGQTRRRLFQHDDLLLAQWRGDETSSNTALLATDQQRSVLHALEGQMQQPMVYAPYGHRTVSSGIAHLPGFNGERLDPVTGHYLLGNGYRAFNPVLMRFNSPDSLSPFGEGGLNAYAYCVGDPVNRADPSGHLPNWSKVVLRRLGLIKKPASPPVQPRSRSSSTSSSTSSSSISSTSTSSSSISSTSTSSSSKVSGNISKRSTRRTLSPEETIKQYDRYRTQDSKLEAEIRRRYNCGLEFDLKHNLRNFYPRLKAMNKHIDRLISKGYTSISHDKLLYRLAERENFRSRDRFTRRILCIPPHFLEAPGLPSYLDAAIVELKEQQLNIRD